MLSESICITLGRCHSRGCHAELLEGLDHLTMNDRFTGLVAFCRKFDMNVESRSPWPPRSTCSDRPVRWRGRRRFARRRPRAWRVGGGVPGPCAADSPSERFGGRRCRPPVRTGLLTERWSPGMLLRPEESTREPRTTGPRPAAPARPIQSQGDFRTSAFSLRLNCGWPA